MFAGVAVVKWVSCVELVAIHVGGDLTSGGRKRPWKQLTFEDDLGVEKRIGLEGFVVKNRSGFMVGEIGE